MLVFDASTGSRVVISGVAIATIGGFTTQAERRGSPDNAG
jgi:hypothetical protein